MPVDYSGTWDMISNENFEGYMIALGKCLSSCYIVTRIINCLFVSNDNTKTLIELNDFGEILT